MSLSIYYDKDTDLGLIANKKISIIGYGSFKACACIKLKR